MNLTTLGLRDWGLLEGANSETKSSNYGYSSKGRSGHISKYIVLTNVGVMFQLRRWPWPSNVNSRENVFAFLAKS